MSLKLSLYSAQFNTLPGTCSELGLHRAHGYEDTVSEGLRSGCREPRKGERGRVLA